MRIDILRKKSLSHFVAFLVLIFWLSATFPAVEFIKEDLSLALAQAQKEKKKMMVFFYTDWCGWCKAMDKHIFADKKVSEFSRTLINVRINAEKGYGLPLARRFKVGSFPTVIFLDSWGKEIDRINGYLPAQYFLKTSQEIIKNGRRPK